MMKWMKAAAFAATLACGPAFAADSGFYFGVFGGQADYSLAEPTPPPLPAGVFSGTPSLNPAAFIDSRFAAGGTVLLPPGGFFNALSPPPPFASPMVFAPSSWITIDNSDDATAWGVTVGYKIIRYAAVELSWLDLGDINQSLPIYTVPPLQPYELRQQVDTTGPTLSGLGMLPVGAGFTLYLRAGVLFAEMQLESSTPARSTDISFSSQSFLWGAGVQFDWGDHWSARLDFQRFEDVGEDYEPVQADIDLLNVGVFYRL